MCIFISLLERSDREYGQYLKSAFGQSFALSVVEYPKSHTHVMLTPLYFWHNWVKRS